MSEHQAGLVSVIMPVFNENPQFLYNAISSILNQSYTNIELIIIDDSFNSDCKDTINQTFTSDLRVRYIKPHSRLGISESLNYGCFLAKGEFIARMDSDDIALPYRLEKQISRLDQDSQIGLVGCNIYIINTEEDIIGERAYPSDNATIQKKIHFVTPLAHPTVVFRKSVFEKSFGYNKSLSCAEDLDLWLRLSNQGVVMANIPECLLKYRRNVEVRDNKHWVANLKARLMNLTLKNIHLRILGIVYILFWLGMPHRVRLFIYGQFT